jgi:hypothetical protein
MNTFLEIVKIYDYERFVVINKENEESFQFRLEIIYNLSTNIYMGKVYQSRMYRLQPTFPQTDGYPPDYDSDELIYVAYNMIDSNSLIGTSIKEVIENFQKYLYEIHRQSNAGVNSQMYPLLEVVKTYDFEPYKVINDEPFRYRLEIAQNLRTKTYIGKVYRLETYRLQPTFPQSNGCPPERLDDVLVFVDDHIIDPLNGASINEILEKFQRYFHEIFKK